MENKLLQDSDGNTSSKRVAGFIAFGAAVALAVVALMWADNADVAKDLVNSFLFFSGGLLGVGVAEKLIKR